MNPDIENELFQTVLSSKLDQFRVYFLKDSLFIYKKCMYKECV